MSLSKEQLKELEQLGEIQFTLSECAVVLQCSLKDLQDDNATQAYQRGRLIASAAVRQAILQQAKQGSSPAQKQMLELIHLADKQVSLQSQQDIEELSKTFAGVMNA